MPEDACDSRDIGVEGAKKKVRQAKMANRRTKLRGGPEMPLSRWFILQKERGNGFGFLARWFHGS